MLLPSRVAPQMHRDAPGVRTILPGHSHPQEGRMPAALKFDENVAREICDRMAEGETLSAICKTQGMPG